MATVTYIREKRQSPSAMRGVIRYCSQETKTVDENGRRYLSGVNCTGENALQEFLLTKEAYHKNDGMNFYQYVQSFSPDEPITYAQAHEIALEFAAMAWPGYEVLVATHCDAAHPHSHFVVNSVSFENGKKLRQHPDTLKQLRALSDEICTVHGFSVIQSDAESKKTVTQKYSAREYRAALKMESWKQTMSIQIETAMEAAGSRAEFISLMQAEGYGVTWTPERKYITYVTPEGKRCRDIKLHETKFTKEAMEHEFRIREALARGIESQGTSGAAGRRKRRPLRDRDGAELEGAAGPGAAACRSANRADRPERFAGDTGTPGQVHGLADPVSAQLYDRDGGSDGGVSEEAESGSGSLYQRGPDGSIRFVETGWEREREVFLRLAGGAQSHAALSEKALLDLSSAHGNHPALSAGLDALASVASLFDDDSEDPEERQRRIRAAQNARAMDELARLVCELLDEADRRRETKTEEAPQEEAEESASYTFEL